MLGPGGSLVGGDVQQTIDKLMEPLADIVQMEASTRPRSARLTGFFKPKASTSAGWPSGHDSEDAETTHALDALYRAAMALNRTGTRSTADMSEVFTQLDNLTLARRVRLHLSTGLVPDVIWIALFAGAGLTIYFAVFFGSPNALAQLAMTAFLSILLTFGLVVVISLDHPFSGLVHISPESLERVLAIAKQG